MSTQTSLCAEARSLGSGPQSKKDEEGQQVDYQELPSLA